MKGRFYFFFTAQVYFPVRLCKADHKYTPGSFYSGVFSQDQVYLPLIYAGKSTILTAQSIRSYQSYECGFIHFILNSRIACRLCETETVSDWQWLSLFTKCEVSHLDPKCSWKQSNLMAMFHQGEKSFIKITVLDWWDTLFQWNFSNTLCFEQGFSVSSLHNKDQDYAKKLEANNLDKILIILRAESEDCYSISQNCFIALGRNKVQLQPGTSISWYLVSESEFEDQERSFQTTPRNWTSSSIMFPSTVMYSASCLEFCQPNE